MGEERKRREGDGKGETERREMKRPSGTEREDGKERGERERKGQRERERLGEREGERWPQFQKDGVRTLLTIPV